jgi:hypothetical protein
MFFVRPIARDDLPAVLALSERTGAGLTTLPASRERLAGRIDRSIASFAGTAPREDACYVFVLVESGRPGSDARVVGIGAIEAAVGLKEPWYPGDEPARSRPSTPRRARSASTRRCRRCSCRTTTPATPSSARCSSTRRSGTAATGR